MPATFTGTQGLQKTSTLTAAAKGAHRATLVAVVKPSESQAAHAYIFAETVDATNDDYRFGFRMIGTDIIGEVNMSTGLTLTATAATAGCAVGEWAMVILERDGDTLSLWVLNMGTNLNASQERLWRNTGPHATASGIGTAAFSSTIACINIGRAPTNINLNNPDGLGVTVQRFRGDIAFCAAYPGKLTRRDRSVLFNKGTPNRLAFETLSIKPQYLYTLSDQSGAWEYDGELALNSVLPAFAKNDTVWADCLDPIRMDPAFLDNDTRVRAFWTFNDASDVVNGTSSVFYDRINRIPLTYATSPAGNGAGALITRKGDGIFGNYGLELASVGLWVNPSEVLANALLQFVGASARVTVGGWFKVRQSFAEDSVHDQRQMGLIAGKWDESDSEDNRCYALFHSLADINGFDEYMPPYTVNGHTSYDGGDSPGQSANYEVAYSGASFEAGTWQYMAMSWDGQYTRVYVNGRLIPSPRNPFDPAAAYSVSDYALFDTAAPFRVGGVDTTGGGGWGNWAKCVYGGLFVIEGELTEDEHLKLARGTAP